MNTTADAVVIGAGALGTSIAYHLARAGLKRVTLLDRFAIGSQTSPRAAGLTQQIRPEPEMTRIAMRSVEKIVGFAEETGVAMPFHQSGSVKMARRDADVRQIEEEIRAGQALGLDIRPIDAGDLADLAPWARADGVRAMWFTPSDLYLEPRLVPERYAQAAAQIGVDLRPHTPATDIAREGGRVAGVETPAGRISAPVVVDAAGAWTRAIAAEAGIEIPIVPMRHQLFITEPIAAAKPEHAICRVIDANVYVRPCWGGLMLGGYEAHPRPYDMREVPPDFQIADLPLDLGVLRDLAQAVEAQFPGLATAPLQQHRGGLPTMTADGRHIVGAVPGAAGFYTATGCCVGGLSVAPAIGESLAQLIATGASDIPLDILSIDRFAAGFASDADLVARCVDSYAHHYAEGWDAG
ncbi:MAG TPA: FAD-binding oxidoreductase [Thermomicrobiales bacterium]|nr:FAD-binding oxidoreductase [Thermomicrobiales bacterium]